MLKNLVCIIYKCIFAPMRKKYFRYLMVLLRDCELIVKRKYRSNLRVFETEKLKFILVNDVKAGTVQAYYYYKPENIFLILFEEDII